MSSMSSIFSIVQLHFATARRWDMMGGSVSLYMGCHMFPMFALRSLSDQMTTSIAPGRLAAQHMMHMSKPMDALAG